MKKYTLYYLLDENKIPFYVGITSNFKKRLSRHRWESIYPNKHYNLPKNCKLRSVMNKNNTKIEDLMIIIKSNIEEKDIDNIEKYHIKKLKSKGIKIKNLTIGGRNAHAYDKKLQRKAAKKRIGKKISEETKKRISLSNKGVKKSKEHKKALSEAWKTRPPHSKKTLKKMKESMIGKNTSQYRLTDPTGKIYIVDGLVKFCIKHKLSHPNLSKVASGQRLHHKGWKAEKILTTE